MISCYVSVLAKGKSFGPQFDNTDNFILQLNSTQEIKIWENPEGKLPPFNSDEHELNETDLGEPLESISLRVGKVLNEFNTIENGIALDLFLRDMKKNKLIC